MGLILHVTSAGRAQRQQARLNGTALPRFSSYVLDTAETQDIDNPTIELLHESSDPQEFAIRPIDDTAFGIHILTKSAFSGWVRGIGLKTEGSDEIYAYHRLHPDNNGFYKTENDVLRFPLVLAEDGRETVEFTFSVLDIGDLIEEIKAGLMEDLRAEMKAMIEGYLCRGIKVPNMGELLECGGSNE